MQYAEVAVNVPVSTTFHYHVPPELAGRLQPGHLVRVSFGTAEHRLSWRHRRDAHPRNRWCSERFDPHRQGPAHIDTARWLVGKPSRRWDRAWLFRRRGSRAALTCG
jgi:primosomal protein N'